MQSAEAIKHKKSPVNGLPLRMPIEERMINKTHEEN